MYSWRTAVAEALADGAAFLLPVACAGCGRPDVSLCPVCVAALSQPPVLRTLPGGLAVRSALRYEGAVAGMMRALKEDGRTALARPLGAALATAAEGTPAGARFVPVPASRASLRRRGYRVVELLMRRAGLLPVRCLRIVRGTHDQRSLGRAARAGNVAGSLAATASVRGVPVVIVDDVVTTGATLGEARRALRAAGADVLAAVTVAATPRRASMADSSSAPWIGQ